MNMFEKKREKIPVTEHKEVDGAQVWVVSWNSLMGRYYNSPTLVNCERRAKAFLSEKDAMEFKNALENAMKFLQCSFEIDINVEKQT